MRSNAYYFTFRSLTAGQRGVKVLKQANIPAKLNRAPSGIVAQGCGYAIEVQAWDGIAAKARLLACAPFEKIYQLQPNGRPQEVEL